MNLTQNSEGPNTQIVHTTHSPIFVGMDRFDAIRVCRKANSGGKVPCTSICLYDLESASSHLDKICDRKRKLANPRDNFRIRSAPVMNFIVNEGFFSDFVVLIEGPTDAAVLWKVQEHLGSNWDKLSISLVPVGSKEAIMKPKIVFDGFGIPNYVVFDKHEPGALVNKRLLKLLGVSTSKLPNEKIHETWAYNDTELEDELKRMLGENTYEEVWVQVQKELECDDIRIRKNSEAVARFIELVYQRGLSLPHYQKIVRKIGNLYKKKPR